MVAACWACMLAVNDYLAFFFIFLTEEDLGKDDGLPVPYFWRFSVDVIYWYVSAFQVCVSCDFYELFLFPLLVFLYVSCTLTFDEKDFKSLFAWRFWGRRLDLDELMRIMSELRRSFRSWFMPMPLMLLLIFFGKSSY